VIGIAGKRNSSGAGWYMLCGATAVDTGNGKQVTINYDGTTICNGLTRTGTVTITLTSGATWQTQGAVLNVAISNVKVTNTVTGNSLTLNGTHTITNETGGLAWEMFLPTPVGTTVKHRDKSSNMSVTFSDGSTGSWSVDRTRIWTLGTNGGVNFEVTSENTGNEDTWGTNRYGEQFNTTIGTPIQADNNSNCPWRPYVGLYTYNVPSRSASASILFGTNGSGASVGTATTCAPGYYLTYTLSTYNYTLHLFEYYW
jgi:hypothetical protein